MHDDASNIFNLYLEAVEEQPKMTTDEYGNKRWRLHGKLHRRDGPAIEGAGGSKSWWLHNKLHREDDPAVEDANGSKLWYLHGKLHRKDGPAVEDASGNKAWFLHGQHYESAEAWAKDVLKERNEPHDDAAVVAFLRPILKKDASASL